jgi:hypothetical protein
MRRSIASRINVYMYGQEAKCICSGLLGLRTPVSQNLAKSTLMSLTWPDDLVSDIIDILIAQNEDADAPRENQRMVATCALISNTFYAAASSCGSTHMGFRTASCCNTRAAGHLQLTSAPGTRRAGKRHHRAYCHSKSDLTPHWGRERRLR